MSRSRNSRRLYANTWRGKLAATEANWDKAEASQKAGSAESLVLRLCGFFGAARQGINKNWTFIK
jgi:hypothetical protein